MSNNYKDSDDSYFPEGTLHIDEKYDMGALHFIWDKAKNIHNIEVHKIDFKTAAMVFNDDFCLINDDYEHSDGEYRESITGQPVDLNDTIDVPGIGIMPRTIIGKVGDVLFVVYTIRGDEYEDIEYIRIISARKADAQEVKAYEESKYDMFM